MEPKTESEHVHNWRRRLLHFGVPLLAVAAVGVVVLVGGGSGDDEAGSSTTTSPSGLGFPTPESEIATSDLDYLEGDGRALIVVHERAKAFVELEATAERCREEAQNLDDAAPADEVVSLTGNVRDAVLRTALHAERTGLGVALTRCITGDVATGNEPLPELERAVEAVEIRLRELAAAR